MRRLNADSFQRRFYDFIDYIEQTTFGIACDAQANFKVRVGVKSLCAVQS